MSLFSWTAGLLSFFHLNSSHSKPSWDPETGSQLIIHTSIQLQWFTSTEHSGSTIIKNCHRENIQPIHSGYIYIGCFYFCFVSLLSPLLSLFYYVLVIWVALQHSYNRQLHNIWIYEEQVVAITNKAVKNYTTAMKSL